MKLYQSIGPNPRAVKMFIAEKGLDIERVGIDLPGGENRRGPYMERTPRARRLVLNWTTAATSPRSRRSANTWRKPIPIRP